MYSEFVGKSIIVTGGSKGIGRGIARAFAAYGGHVMVAARNKSKLDQVVEETSQTKGMIRATACDVSDWDAVQHLVEETGKAFGGIDILCANAGIFPQAHIIDLSPEEWDRVLTTNLKSTFLCVKACLPWFAQKTGARVVVTSSITGPITGYPGWAHYGSAKAGQMGFIRAAAMELARYSATINAVMPGSIHTEGLAELGQDYLKSAAKAIPLQRLGTVEDIANAVLFFASNSAAYITGQSIVVDGGQILPETVNALAAV